MKSASSALLMILAFAATNVFADSLSPYPAQPVVVAGTSDRSHQVGTIYAKSVPVAGSFVGTNGSTVIYRVGEQNDRVVNRFPWYSAGMQLALVRDKICVFQPGKWNVGWHAQSNDVAFTLYCDGQLLRQYNTLELCGSPTNVDRTMSHYNWAGEFMGFHHSILPGNKTYRYVFAVRHVDGRILCFDPLTGAQFANTISKPE